MQKSSSVYTLYHATYKAHLPSIMQWGLGGAPEMPPPNYNDSKRGVVYMATSADVAISYAETSDTVPEDWLDEIVVLTIDCRKLDSTLLLGDENVLLDEGHVGDTLQYGGVIVPDAISCSDVTHTQDDPQPC